MDEITKVIREREQSERDDEYRSQCDRFAAIPEDFIYTLKGGLIAKIEIQASRWIRHGLALIGSRKASGTIQLYASEGPDYRAFLPYPVFQMGAEIFLKGMWLYQHEECRKCMHTTYVAPDVRQRLFNEVKGLSPEHDLLVIIRKVEVINEYAQDKHLSRFLKVLGGIARYFYIPVTAGKSDWADERYPKRFYNDSSKTAAADALHEYPEHWVVDRLFKEAAEQVELVWPS